MIAPVALGCDKAIHLGGRCMVEEATHLMVARKKEERGEGHSPNVKEF